MITQNTLQNKDNFFFYCNFNVIYYCCTIIYYIEVTFY
jgi:hypothetical protein